MIPAVFSHHRHQNNPGLERQKKHTMWFSGQSGVGVRTWSGAHGYVVRDHSWGAFCEDEGEVSRVLA